MSRGLDLIEDIDMSKQQWSLECRCLKLWSSFDEFGEEDFHAILCDYRVIK